MYLTFVAIYHLVYSFIKNFDIFRTDRINFDTLYFSINYIFHPAIDNEYLDQDVVYGDSSYRFSGKDKLISIVTKIKSAGQKQVKLTKYKFVHLPDKLLLRFR